MDHFSIPGVPAPVSRSISEQGETEPQRMAPQSRSISENGPTKSGEVMRVVASGQHICHTIDPNTVGK